MTASILVASGAGIIGLLGTAHLVLTFFGPKLLPRDRSLVDQMAAVSPVITKQTTMWKAWIGFNASHSMGAMLFGLSYGYLALVHRELFFSSIFLQLLGLAMVTGFVVLGKLYWFRTPLMGSTLSMLLYVAGLVLGA